jgi:hypothetical protein
MSLAPTPSPLSTPSLNLLNIPNALLAIPDPPLSISSKTLQASPKHALTSSTSTVPGQRNNTAAWMTAPVNAWKRKNHQW